MRIRKFVLIIALFLPITIIAQTTFPLDNILYLTPDKVYTQKYNNTRASYDSILANYGFIDNVDAFFGSPYCLISGAAVFPNDILYYQPSTLSFGTMNATMLASYISNANILKPIDVNTQSENDLRYLQSEIDPLFNTKFSGKTSDDLTEGSINKYFTTPLFNTALYAKTTDNITEGSTNKYATTANIRAASSAGTGITYIAGVITNTAPDQTVSLTGSNGVTISGTYPNFTISKKRQETYTGTTAGSGTYTVTYSTAYGTTPNVQFNINGGTTTNTARLTSSSTTGFTITANNRVEVLGLLPTYPTLNGLVIDVLVTEK